MRQPVEFLDLGEADVDLRFAGGTFRLDHFRQAMQGLRAEHQIHIWRALHDRRAFLAGDAAADADDNLVVAALEMLPAAKLAEYLLLRLLADRAGVDQDDVGFGLVGSQFKIMGCLEYVGHLRRVILVHLAPVRLDVKLSGHDFAKNVNQPSSLRRYQDAFQRKMM